MCRGFTGYLEISLLYVKLKKMRIKSEKFREQLNMMLVEDQIQGQLWVFDNFRRGKKEWREEGSKTNQQAKEAEKDQ